MYRKHSQNSQLYKISGKKAKATTKGTLYEPPVYEPCFYLLFFELAGGLSLQSRSDSVSSVDREDEDMIIAQQVRFHSNGFPWQP